MGVGTGSRQGRPVRRQPGGHQQTALKQDRQEGQGLEEDVCLKGATVESWEGREGSGRMNVCILA